MSDKLKPCPFCGGEAYVGKEWNPPMIIIECRNVDQCNILPSFSVDVPCKENKGDTPTFTPQFDSVIPEAVKAWNRRVHKDSVGLDEGKIRIDAWINEDELTEKIMYDALYPLSKVDFVRMFPKAITNLSRGE